MYEIILIFVYFVCFASQNAILRPSVRTGAPPFKRRLLAPASRSYFFDKLKPPRRGRLSLLGHPVLGGKAEDIQPAVHQGLDQKGGQGQTVHQEIHQPAAGQQNDQADLHIAQQVVGAAEHQFSVDGVIDPRADHPGQHRGGDAAVEQQVIQQVEQRIVHQKGQDGGEKKPGEVPEEDGVNSGPVGQGAEMGGCVRILQIDRLDLQLLDARREEFPRLNQHLHLIFVPLAGQAQQFRPVLPGEGDAPQAGLSVLELDAVEKPEEGPGQTVARS